MLRQDAGSNLVDLTDEFEHGVIGQLALGKLALGDVAWVSLPQNSVPVARNNLACLESAPKVVGNGLVT